MVVEVGTDYTSEELVELRKFKINFTEVVREIFEDEYNANKSIEVIEKILT
jgi:hypothetical protein